MYFQDKYPKLLWVNVKILPSVQPVLLEISLKKIPVIKGIFLLIMISTSSVIVITDIHGIYLQYLYACCIPHVFGRALLALDILHAEQGILKGMTIKSEGIYGVLFSMNCSYVRIVLNRRCSLAFVLFLVTIVFFTVLQAVEH